MKRFMTIGLAALVLCLIVSCSPKSQPSSSGSQVSGSQVSGGGGIWPAVGSASSPVKVTYILKDVFPDEPDMKALFEKIEAGMASHGQYVDIVLLEPPASAYATALPLAITSGELSPDIVYFQGGDLLVGQGGYLEDLTSYIGNSTYVKGMLQPENVERMKNYPYLLWLATPRVSVPVMRKDFASQLTSYTALVADPTVENYYKMFKEMKDKKLVSEAAVSEDGGLGRLDSYFNHAFGITDTIIQENGKWIYSMASQASRAKLEFYRRLYAENLLHHDFITDAWDKLEQKFYENRIGIIAGTAGDVIQIYDTKMMQTYGTDASLVALPPAKGVSQSYLSLDTTKEPRGLAINAKSKVKDAAWAVLEFMASPEGRIIDKCGIEGVHYNVVGGKIVFTDRFPEWWSRCWPTPLNLNPSTPLAEPVLTAGAQQSLDLVAKYAKNDTNVLVPEEMAPQYDAIRALYNEYAMDIVTGLKPVSVFDEFVTKFRAAGGDAFSAYFATVLK